MIIEYLLGSELDQDRPIACFDSYQLVHEYYIGARI